MDFARPLRVITPTLDGDVLTTLAGAESEFTGRQLSRLVAAGSERGVRDALDRLVRQGIVNMRPAGASKLYELNREHLAAAPVVALAEMRAELLQRLTAACRAMEPRPLFALVFGSVARGAASEESDLDLLLVSPSMAPSQMGQWEEAVFRLQRNASSWTGNDTRVLEYDESTIRAEGEKDPVLDEVARDGVPLVGRLGEFRRLVTGAIR